MYVNINVRGWDFELKLRRKDHATPKVIVVPDEENFQTITEVAEWLR
ncbi:hypothetical protein SEA_ARCHERNM_37 [Mycobacterium phage ArcherNM]|nr:hypothetical protein BJD71_gp37 [Mycobacterium phage ArcherNM]AMS01031.1 hypothetical protein SEA_ARCHERNM_37 [Mycobacterium phage ArcherNM]